jgi:hypothetical protein
MAEHGMETKHSQKQQRQNIRKLKVKKSPASTPPRTKKKQAPPPKKPKRIIAANEKLHERQVRAREHRDKWEDMRSWGLEPK